MTMTDFKKNTGVITIKSKKPSRKTEQRGKSQDSMRKMKSTKEKRVKTPKELQEVENEMMSNLYQQFKKKK